MRWPDETVPASPSHTRDKLGHDLSWIPGYDLGFLRLFGASSRKASLPCIHAGFDLSHAIQEDRRRPRRTHPSWAGSFEDVGLRREARVFQTGTLELGSVVGTDREPLWRHPKQTHLGWGDFSPGAKDGLRKLRAVGFSLASLPGASPRADQRLARWSDPRMVRRPGLSANQGVGSAARGGRLRKGRRKSIE